ncbi:MAG: hypothetical protein MJ186_03335 [Clostridia bacterium]|nr:hypothetical protein [Clostridia bacterium]
MVKKYLKSIENMLSYETDLQTRMRKAVKISNKETLTVRHSKFGDRYYLTKRRADGSYSRERIRENSPLFKVLLRKRVAASYLKTVDANVSLLGNLLSNYSEIPENDAALFFVPKNDSSIISIDSMDTLSWEMLQSDRNYRSEGLLYKSEKGSFRSKSELLIASRLELFGLEYIYEPVIRIGRVYYHPDFAIRRKSDGRILFWEHFGMMDRRDYVVSAGSKLAAYADAGLIINHNLLITCETADVPLNIDQIDSVIKAWLL